MGLVTWKKFLKKTSSLDRFLFMVTFVGVVIAITSLFRGIVVDRRVKVEYLNNGNSLTNVANNKIFVDIEGAVINGGVYELPEGSRLKDVLVMAGGLSDKADRTFCEKVLNMAELLKDGQKIFIPDAIDTNAPQGYVEAKSTSNLININSASVSELDTLWGIGSARAESIVKNRPYKSLDELVEKKVLTKTNLEKIRELISVY